MSRRPRVTVDNASPVPAGLLPQRAAYQALEYLQAVLRVSLGRRDRTKLMVADAIVSKNARWAPSKPQLGKAEVDAILQAVHSSRLYLLVLSAASAGPRQGELLGRRGDGLPEIAGFRNPRREVQWSKLWSIPMKSKYYPSAPCVL